MRWLLLVSVLSLGAPAVAADGDAAAMTERDIKGEYTRTIKLIDDWFKARDADNPRAVGLVDEKLVAMFNRELADMSRAAELEPVVEDKKAKKKKKGKGADLSMAADLLGDDNERDFPRLRAIVQEMVDLQPKFDRMEVTAVGFLDKERKLKELRALLKAEITEPRKAPVVAAAPEKAEVEAKKADAMAAGESAGGPVAADAAAVEEAVKAEEPVQRTVELLDEPEDKKKAKKAKKEKKDKKVESRPAAPEIDDLDE